MKDLGGINITGMHDCIAPSGHIQRGEGKWFGATAEEDSHSKSDSFESVTRDGGEND